MKGVLHPPLPSQPPGLSEHGEVDGGDELERGVAVDNGVRPGGVGELEDHGLDLLDAVRVVADDPGERGLADLLQLTRAELDVRVDVEVVEEAVAKFESVTKQSFIFLCYFRKRTRSLRPRANHIHNKSM